MKFSELTNGSFFICKTMPIGPFIKVHKCDIESINGYNAINIMGIPHKLNARKNVKILTELKRTLPF